MTDQRSPILILAGLGLDYPGQATLEVLKALTTCDVIFSNLSGTSSMKFLNLFCSDVRAVGYQNQNDEAFWSRRIVSALKSGRRVAFVTRGNPMVSGNLVNELIVRAKRKGAEVQNYPAISTIDTILSMAEDILSVTSLGIQVYDSRLISEKKITVQAGLPAVLYLGVRRGPQLSRRIAKYAAALSKSLIGQYPPGHGIFLHGPRYDVKTLEPLRLSELEGRIQKENPEMVSSLILMLPPLPRLRPQTSA